MFLLVSNLGLAAYASLKLGDEFRRLLFDTSESGANDLHNFYLQTPAWFDGHRAFIEFNLSPYPPASFAIILPFVSRFDWTGTRWLWAIVSLFALGWLVFLAVQSSGARTQIECALAALMLLSMNATGVTIGNGQLILLVLPTLLTGLLLLRDANRFRHDFLASALITFSLVKPSISAPFLLLVLLPNRLRPVLLVAGMYSLLTFFALIPQFPNLNQLIPDILFRSSAAVTTRGSYANLTIWLANLGLGEWSLAAALPAFVLLGVWLYYHRQADFWILVGITGLVARFWFYHAVYDDVLIILPMIALFRIAKHSAASEERGILAGILLAVNIVTMLFLARWQYLPSPWHLIFTGGHTLVWLADLIFLLDSARQTHSPFEGRLEFLAR